MTEHQIQLNHYRVLDLPSSPHTNNEPSQNDIKVAYRRALLRHHPDKHEKQRSNTYQKPTYTLDQIFLAYKILLDPLTRSDYDRSLKTTDSAGSTTRGQDAHPGLETCDLDDLAFDSERSVWSKICRCGNPRGFEISEKDLEESVEYGEIITGCRGCSLWLRVTFATVDDG